MVLGDINAGHGLPPHLPGPDRMVSASRFVFIRGIPVCRQGDVAGCGHLTTGSSVVFTDI